MPAPACVRARMTPTHALGGVAAASVLLLGSALGAHADERYPSQADVDRSRAAVAGTGLQIAALDARYAQAAAEVASTQERAARLGEAANGAAYELKQATKAAAEARRKAQAAQSEAKNARADLRDYAVAVYEQGGAFDSLGPLLEAGHPQDFVDRAASLEIVGANQEAGLRSALVVSATADALEREAAAAEAARTEAAQQAQEAERMARDELALAGSQASRLSRERSDLALRLADLRSTTADLERRRLDASNPTQSGNPTAPPTVTTTSRPPAPTTTRPPAPTSTRPPTSNPTTPTSTTTTPTSTTTTPTTTSTTPPPAPPPTSTTPPPPPPPPPPAGGTAAVLAYAQAQLGKPYVWGAAGPDAFDCSGLTLMAWQQAGVYLSHYTGAQWAETQRVALADLAPGDLVFFGASGESSYHVGLYVGDGQMIEAPHTGAVVRYASIYRSDLLPYGGRPG